MKHQTAILSARSMILQVLLDGPASGTELKRIVPERSNDKMQLLSGSVYPALTAMHEQGFAKIDATSRYSLTKKGQKLAKTERDAILQLMGLTSGLEIALGSASEEEVEHTAPEVSSLFS